MRQLQLAYSRKEKVTRLMSNLETLRSQDGVSDEDYPTIRSEYETFLNSAEESIEQLRQQIEQQIERHEQELGVLERDRQRMEVRLKVGELSQEKFAREVGRVDRRIMNTQNDIARLRKSLEANSSAELGGFVDVPIEDEPHRTARIDIERVSESASRVVERMSSRLSAEGGLCLVLPDEWILTPRWITLIVCAVLMFVTTLLPWEQGIGQKTLGFVSGGLGAIAFISAILACGTLFVGKDYAHSVTGLVAGGLATLVGMLKLVVGPHRAGAIWVFIIASVVFTVIHYRAFSVLHEREGTDL